MIQEGRCCDADNSDNLTAHQIIPGLELRNSCISSMDLEESFQGLKKIQLSDLVLLGLI